MAESFWQSVGRKVFGADQARQQDDYGGLALEKVARNNPEKIAELAKEDETNTKKSEGWEKAAAGGLGVLSAVGAAMAQPAQAAKPQSSPFLSAYIQSRRNALNQKIVGG